MSHLIDTLQLLELQARRPVRRQAVVVGASLGGLLAARALSPHFDRVVLLERGELALDHGLRRSTPHTRHSHGMLARGSQVLEGYFPGISQHWLALGAQEADIQQGITFYAGARRLAAGRFGATAFALGRGVIEGSVRQRVLALPNVVAAAGIDVRGLLGDARRVGGVLWRASQDDPAAQVFELTANLVVDASGRGSRLPQWLHALGASAAREERVEVDIRYATAWFERDPQHAHIPAAVLHAARPDKPLPGVLLAQEGSRWTMSLGGYGGDVPPLDRIGFIARAQRMGPELAAVARSARMIGEPFAYRYAHSQRRHYQKLRDHPAGVLAFADAMCSFNPVFGQGMSVAACHALALDQALKAGEANLTRCFYAQAARSIDTAWATAVGADLALPCVPGPRPLPVRIINHYIAAVFRAAEHDPQVHQAFQAVAHLLAQPPSLMRPAIAWRVVRGAWRARGQSLPQQQHVNRPLSPRMLEHPPAQHRHGA